MRFLKLKLNVRVKYTPYIFFLYEYEYYFQFVNFCGTFTNRLIALEFDGARNLIFWNVSFRYSEYRAN